MHFMLATLLMVMLLASGAAAASAIDAAHSAVDLTDESLERTVRSLKPEKPCIIEFYASWRVCGGLEGNQHTAELNKLQLRMHQGDEPLVPIPRVMCALRCPHCQRYAPFYEKAALFFKKARESGHADVFVGRLDCAAQVKNQCYT